MVVSIIQVTHAFSDSVKGQGVWYALTHRPDKIIGASPVSGYSSIQGKLSFCYGKFVWCFLR